MYFVSDLSSPASFKSSLDLQSLTKGLCFVFDTVYWACCIDGFMYSISLENLSHRICYSFCSMLSVFPGFNITYLTFYFNIFYPLTSILISLLPFFLCILENLSGQTANLIILSSVRSNLLFNISNKFQFTKFSIKKLFSLFQIILDILHIFVGLSSYFFKHYKIRL